MRIDANDLDRVRAQRPQSGTRAASRSPGPDRSDEAVDRADAIAKHFGEFVVSVPRLGIIVLRWPKRVIVLMPEHFQEIHPSLLQTAVRCWFGDDAEIRAKRSDAASQRCVDPNITN